MLRSADWLVVALAAALVGALAVWTWTPSSAAHTVEIRGGGRTLAVPLKDDQRVRVEGFIGVSEIELVESRARFVGAPCRNRVCVAAGWLSASGDFAACAPNGVSVLLRGGAERYDAINY